jgi:6-pyruvoyl-tetrahydropterin synthase related domain
MSDARSPGPPSKGWVPQVSILRPGKPLLSWTLIGPALIFLAAAAATAPILLHGSFCGDDFEFHTVSWFDAQQSWLQGVAYPHWMPSANYSAGEPRFIFYPPLTWMLGAALGFVLPWPLVPIAIVFLFLAATGLAVRALALEVLPNAPATLAGCAALFSGFALFTAYERTAFAELSGGFWIPLLLLYALRDRNPSVSLWRRALDGATLPLALILAGCWLSDGPVGVMASYLLAAVALAASVMARSWAHLLRASIAAVLGIALTALYLIPAAREQSWVDLRAAVDYPVFNIENNWLFARPTDPQLAPFQYFLHRASMLTAFTIGVALLGLVVLFVRQKYAPQIQSAPFTLRWAVPLALIPVAVLILQFPISLPIWNLLPKLRFLQYPWRWVLVVEAPMAIFLAAAVWPGKLARQWQRTVVIALCAAFFLTTTYFSAKTFLRVCKEGDTVADLLEQYHGGGGLEGTDEYEPPDSDHWKIATGLPDACFSSDSDTTLGVADAPDAIPAWRPEQGSCEATATARLRRPEHLRIDAVTAHPGFLILRLLSYPAWSITVNGQPTSPADPRDDGLIAVPVPEGRVEVAVDWTTTPDVIAGRWVSAVALLLLVGLGFLERKRSVLP